MGNLNCGETRESSGFCALAFRPFAGVGAVPAGEGALAAFAGGCRPTLSRVEYLRLLQHLSEGTELAPLTDSHSAPPQPIIRGARELYPTVDVRPSENVNAGKRAPRYADCQTEFPTL